jgi:STE24 endopeptidase
MNPTPEAIPDLEPASPEVKRYQRQKHDASILSLALTLVFLCEMALFVGPTLQKELPSWIGENRWLMLIVTGFLIAAGMELLTLPIDFYSGFILEHRYHLSNQTFRAWLWRHAKGYLIGGPLGLLMLVGLYALIWNGGPWWWLWAAAGWLGVTLVLGRLVPVLILPLFYKVTRLEDAVLLQRLQQLASGTGLGIEGVYRLHLSEETKKANAALAGLGRTRRVLLGDTLLEQFTPEEIEVVFAHEIGHHVHRHLSKMIVWSVVLTAGGLALVNLVLHRSAAALGYASFDDPAALPLLMLVLALFGLTLAPLQNAVSRFFERQCDRYALQRTRMAEAYRSAFAKLARLNKADPDPHPLVVWLWYDHPPIRQRLAMASELAPVSGE